MSVKEFPCKGKMPDGSPCPLTVTFEPDPIIGTLSIDFEADSQEKDIVVLTCDNDHTCEYKI
jgi:hypothetical protein